MVPFLSLASPKTSLVWGTQQMLRAQNDRTGNLTPYLTPQTKPPPPPIHCLEDDIREYLHDLGIGEDSQRGHGGH